MVINEAILTPKSNSKNSGYSSADKSFISSAKRDLEQFKNTAMLNMILAEEQNIDCLHDNSHDSTSTRPPGDESNTSVSSSSNLSHDVCINYSRSSNADSYTTNQTLAEQEGLDNDSLLSQVSDQSSVYSSLVSNYSTIMHDLSFDTDSSQPNVQCLLDLGLKNKGFRMGHLNIQGVSNKIDQVSLLLRSEKNQFHVLGLSETKLNTNHPDSAFEINGYQKPFRRDREFNSGGGLLVYVRDGVCCNRRTDLEHWNLECIWVEIKPVRS